MSDVLLFKFKFNLLVQLLLKTRNKEKKKQQAENGHLRFALIKEQLQQLSFRMKISRRLGVIAGGIISRDKKKKKN